VCSCGAAGADLGQPLGDFLLEAPIGRLIEYDSAQIVGQAAHRIQRILELVGVLVALAISPLFHGPGGGIAELHWNRLGRGVFHGFHGLVQGFIRRVRLGCDGQVQGHLGQGLIALRYTQEVDRLLRGHGLLQGAGVGQPDVLDRHAHQPASQVHPVFPALQHAREPVQRRVRIGRANALVQRRDEIEVLFARLIVEQHLALDHGFDGLAVERAFASHARRGFQNVVGAARVAVGVDRDLLQQVAGRGQFQRLEAAFQ